MITLEQWRQKMKEMAGGDDIVGKCPGKNADFQVWGAKCDPNAKKSTVKFVKKSKK